MPSRKTPKVPDLKTLADPRKAAQHWQKETICPISNALTTIPEGDREYLAKALDNSTARAIDIANALQALGVEITGHEVQMHRATVCRCDNE